MRTMLRSAVATVLISAAVGTAGAAGAGATLFAGVGAGAATADTAPVPDPGPASTGSAVIDLADIGSSMGSSALEGGDVLMVLAVLVNMQHLSVVLNRAIPRHPFRHLEEQSQETDLRGALNRTG